MPGAVSWILGAVSATCPHREDRSVPAFHFQNEWLCPALRASWCLVQWGHAPKIHHKEQGGPSPSYTPCGSALSWCYLFPNLGTFLSVINLSICWLCSGYPHPFAIFLCWCSLWQMEVDILAPNIVRPIQGITSIPAGSVVVAAFPTRRGFPPRDLLAVCQVVVLDLSKQHRP